MKLTEATLGSKFKTYDGETAIYLERQKRGHLLYVGHEMLHYDNDGSVIYEYTGERVPQGKDLNLDGNLRRIKVFFENFGTVVLFALLIPVVLLFVLLRTLGKPIEPKSVDYYPITNHMAEIIAAIID